MIRPRFVYRTGHVTIGGSICMEVLTKSGWRPANDVESVLVQVRAEIMAGGGRVDLNNRNYPAYDKAEAKAAFDRVAAHHGWN